MRGCGGMKSYGDVGRPVYITGIDVTGING